MRQLATWTSLLLLLLLPYVHAFSTGGGCGLPPPSSLHRTERAGACRHQPLRLRSAPRPLSSTSTCMTALDAGAATLLAGEIFGQVALGGVGIILSGLVGVLVVGSIVNLDDVEEDFQNSMNTNTGESEKKKESYTPDVVDINISYDSEVNLNKEEK